MSIRKHKGLGLGLRRSILEIRLDRVRDTLANLQKYFVQVFQTPSETPLKQVSLKSARSIPHVLL